MGMQLFDDVDDNEDISKIEPNLDFAKRYEHNKKREDLQRLEELKKKGLVEDSEDESDSDDDSDDEDAAFMSKEHDLKFYDALLKIKNRDPIINQKDKDLFEESDDDDVDERVGRDKGVKKPKEKFLKDVNAISAIDGGGTESDEDEGKVEIRGKSYWDEQEEIRKAVLMAAQEGDDSDGDLLIEKKRIGGEEEEDEEEDEVSAVVKKLRNEYHGEDEELDENERFLKEYLGKQMWKAKDDERKGFDEMLSADEEEVEKAEEFEAVYNHRFEEGAGDRILGHSRFTEGSVRKKSSARKLQRKSKEERIAKSEFERKEELKRLKNLKKKEIEEKLEKIRAIAGIDGDGACAIDEDDLEEEFDPEEYDRKMKETFDEDYYDEEDVDPGFGSDGDDLEKPDFDKEDELLGLPKDWDVGGSADGFATAREKILKRKAEVDKDSEDVEEELPGESKRKKKRKIPLREKLALDEVLEEYYKLDYEDTIGGDIKTRFKYASVPSQRYGLNHEEILMMEEKELNQYVPLKKLAPYREKEWKVPNSKRYALKMKKLFLGKELDVKDNKRVKKNKHKGEDRPVTETTSLKEEKAQLAKPNGEVTLSRRAKRRRRQADFKLSHARLRAYGINKKKG